MTGHNYRYRMLHNKTVELCHTPTIYLGGSIDKLNPDMVMETFGSVQKSLEEIGFKVLSPVRGKKVGSNHQDFVSYEPNEIVHRDLADIDNADYMLAMMVKPGIGTSMEIMYSRMVRNIPVVVVSKNPAVVHHYWIKSLASKIVPDVETALNYLRDWYL